MSRLAAQSGVTGGGNLFVLTKDWMQELASRAAVPLSMRSE
jgi:hypothetical protein